MMEIPSLDTDLGSIKVSSTLTDGHKRAIVNMFANGTSIPKLAEWYGVTQAEVREVLRPHVRFQVGR